MRVLFNKNMAKTKTDKAKQAKLDLYDKLISMLPDQKRKGAKSAYTSLNGHMFSFLDDKNHFCFRYSEADKRKYIEELNAEESIQYNSVMRGYIVVPEEIEKNEDQLANLFQKSFEYISSLKPKPTKKKKK